MNDLISRQAAIDLIMETDPFWAEGMTRAIFEGVKALPSTQPEQRKGEWIETHERTLFSNPDSITYVCSECGYRQYTLYGTPPITNFCPNCGADMRGET